MFSETKEEFFIDTTESMKYFVAESYQWNIVIRTNPPKSQRLFFFLFLRVLKHLPSIDGVKHVQHFVACVVTMAVAVAQMQLNGVAVLATCFPANGDNHLPQIAVVEVDGRDEQNELVTCNVAKKMLVAIEVSDENDNLVTEKLCVFILSISNQIVVVRFTLATEELIIERFNSTYKPIIISQYIRFLFFCVLVQIFDYIFLGKFDTTDSESKICSRDMP